MIGTMSTLLHVIALSWLAGLAAFAGGMAARLETSSETPRKRVLIHGVVAFGGGVLLAAVALALIPEGIANLHPLALTTIFLAGGGFSYAIDLAMARMHGSGAQLAALLLDFVPEAVSLGAVFAHDRQTGLLLAGFIAVQNLPEGFNAYREMRAGGIAARVGLATLLGASIAGPLAAGIGHLVLQDQPALTAAIMTFASGGIVYLVFQDIAPQAHMRRQLRPPLGAVLGFALGMLGTALLH